MTLKSLREMAGLKQSELAAVSGVNLRSLQDYEQGHKSLYSAKGETLLRLSTALGVSVEEILKGETLYIEPMATDEERMRNRVAAYERCLNGRKTVAVRFPVIAADNEVDMSRVYPTKQQAVKNVLAALRDDKRVSSLRLFGSSITMACHKDSDIDFAVGINDVSRETRNDISEKIQLACDWGADIIWMDHILTTDRIYDNIMKGVILI